MKPLNEVKNLQEQIGEESRQAVLDTLIGLQIEGLERLLETNGAHVKSPLNYNTTAGLIDQLKYYAPASFRDGSSLVKEQETGFEMPIFGKP